MEDCDTCRFSYKNNPEYTNCELARKEAGYPTLRCENCCYWEPVQDAPKAVYKLNPVRALDLAQGALLGIKVPSVDRQDVYAALEKLKQLNK